MGAGRRHGIAAGAIGVALVATGCGIGGGDAGSSAQPTSSVTGEVKGTVSIQTWALKPKFTKYMQGVISGFEKEYPGVKVNWLDQPGDGYSDKVLSQASSGTLPDVVNLPPDFALPMVKQNMLLDVSTQDSNLTRDFVPGSLEAYQYAGTEGTYGYPWYLGTDVNYWNTAMLKRNGINTDQLPTDLDSLISAAGTVKTKSGGKDYLMSRKPGVGDLAQEGIPILSEDGKKFVFNTPQAVALLDKYRKAYSDGLMPRDVLSSKYLGNSELFNQQKVGWTTGGGNTIPSIAESNPTLAKQVVPSKAFGTGPLYVQGLSVSSKSKNLPAAIALARWVTNPQNQAQFAKEVPGVFPSTTASSKDPFFSKSDGTPAGDAKVMAFNTLKTAKLLQPVVVDSAMATFIDQQFALAISGKVSSKKALDDAVKKCNELLNNGQGS